MVNIETVHHKVTAAFRSGKTLDLDFREKQLKALLRLYKEHEREMCEALAKDLNKSRQEAILNEVELLRNDVISLLMNFRKYAKTEYPEKTFANALDSVELHKDPYGVVLIIGPWNYPLQLILLPLASAIAAGNCVVMKPSELAPESAKFVADFLPKYLDNECYQVICGGVQVSAEVLTYKFDYIFYTGSTRVGKIVHAAANKYLTPTTLELGGKSPVYIDNSVDIKVAAARIVWGKLLNIGQTCIAPDYILCTKAIQDKLIAAIPDVLTEFYGKNIQQSPDLCRIVNAANFQRLVSLMNGAEIAIGGKTNEQDRYIDPTVLINVKRSDPIMQEEIFGPILPIINVENAYDALQVVNEGELPLVLYVFSTDKRIQELFIKNTRVGGMCINDTLMHYVVESFPFGGVGMSGMGAYHGKYSFDTFTHKKPCLVKSISHFSEYLTSARYPPYSEKKTKTLAFLIKKRSGISFKYAGHVALVGLGAVVTLLCQEFFGAKL